jgi:O-succinylbenzoate synthase
MIIEQIDLYHISQQLVAPFVTSFGRQEERQCLILSMRGGDITGWGECAATIAPGYSYETVTTAWHILADFLIPALLGKELSEPEEMSKWVDFVRGHPLAKASLDAAAWDLIAKRDGLSLAQKLGQPYQFQSREKVEVGVSIGIQPSIDETLTVIEQFRKSGYQRIKLKIRPGNDIELARAARLSFPNTPIMLDANSAYSLKDAALFRDMDDLDLLMLEQPLHVDDIYDHSQLRPQIRTPLCLDESIHSANHARLALSLEACDIINIKPGRVGGLTEARRIHDICYRAGMPVWCGGMLETGVGRAAQLALASLPGFTMPGDISATDRYYAEDIASPHFVLNPEDSTIDVPKGYGLGVSVDMGRLAKVTLRNESYKA